MEMLKPQDILVLLKLALRDARISYVELGRELGISPSEAHAAIRRARKAGLLNISTFRPNREALLEFLIHGLKYVFPAERGASTRGIPTGFSAPPLKQHFVREPLVGVSHRPIPVWPDPEGEARGEELKPLYKSVPKAARSDPELYELLVLVDAIRSGGAREQRLARIELEKRLAVPLSPASSSRAS
jgi:DNA-binding Lrp family transcriptional regulator